MNASLETSAMFPDSVPSLKERKEERDAAGHQPLQKGKIEDMRESHLLSDKDGKGWSGR